MTGQDGRAVREGQPGVDGSARGGAAERGAAGSAVRRRRPPAARTTSATAARRLLRGRDHLPPARLLGPHRPGRADRARRATARAPSGSTASATSSCSRSSSGCSTPGSRCSNIRTAVEHLRERGGRRPGPDHADERRRQRLRVPSADEVIDLVQGGQGVFGIAVGPGLARGRGHPGRAARRACRRRRAAVPGDELPRAGDAPGTTGCIGEPPRAVARLASPTTPRGRVLPQPATGAEGATSPEPLRPRTVRVRRLWKAEPRGPTDGASRPSRGPVSSQSRRVADRGGASPSARHVLEPHDRPAAHPADCSARRSCRGRHRPVRRSPLGARRREPMLAVVGHASPGRADAPPPCPR